ncbi:MAG: 16S rRNA (adenine(1518)-N(6)/adenine(1519)-N(6))-dimethyltransferase RsmA [Candidatus Firestonebacteria bacterium]|nr:16S rRNA (adenine(1518)-N(6)/adenine(1519)-N(6))-dimethyltransferase RsmA [Candidatus Firestonebacteria bacterium]
MKKRIFEPKKFSEQEEFGAHKARKRFGQNFLTDIKLREFIVNSAAIVNTDTVLEIGPGRGELTGIIAARCPVVAIEIDRDLVKLLKTKFDKNSGVKIIEGDILTFDFETLPVKKLKIIGNVPYYITTPIIFKLLENKDRVLTAIMTIQKEVAERLAAKPGNKDYGVLTVMVGMYAEVEILKIIPAGAFFPAPTVDSAVISIKPRELPLAAVKEPLRFEKLVKTAFQQRRKNIRNALLRFGISKPEATRVLKLFGIRESARPEDVSIEEFAKLTDALRQADLTL